MTKFDPQDKASVDRMTRPIDRAILEVDGGQDWENICDVMGRAMEIYDDPNFEPEHVQ